MKRPAFQFYPKQWLADDQVMRMNWEQRGMHMHLICIAWQQHPACTLPDNDEDLMAWLNLSDKEYWLEKLKPRIFSAWKFINGRWVQEGLSREFIKQNEYKKSRSENAKKRWNNMHMHENENTYASGMHESSICIDDALQSSSSSSPSFSSSSSTSSSSSEENIKILNNNYIVEKIRPNELKDQQSIILNNPSKGITHDEIIEPQKNLRPRKRNKIYSQESKLQIEEVFNFWKDRMGHPNARLDDTRKRYIRNALHMGYTADQIMNAIEGCSFTPHNMGDNDRGQRYDGLHLILRNADQIDRFIKNSHAPPIPQNAAEKREKGNIRVINNWIDRKKREVENEIN
jgi:hypothetical protein